MTQQDQLNTDVQAISAALDSLAGEITDLKGQLAAQVPDSVDLSALDAIAAKAQSLIPSAPADNTPPSSPSNTPGDPTVDTSTATTDPVEDPNADGTVPGTNPTPTV